MFFYDAGGLGAKAGMQHVNMLTMVAKENFPKPFFSISVFGEEFFIQKQMTLVSSLSLSQEPQF